MEEDFEALKHRIKQLEDELNASRKKIRELELSKSAGVSDEITVPISEFEETLRRLVQRTAMIVQAEKCVIMVRDRETGELVARSPAFGMEEKEVSALRVDTEKGISGEVFSSGAPAIFHDMNELTASQDKVLFPKLRLHNGVTVPLLIEKRNDQNHLVERLTIGVLHCFNKRYGGNFIEEDVRLLERLSKNAAAVIANAQMFQDVVEERQKLVHTLESLTSGLLLINNHGKIGQMNAQARAMFAVSADVNPIGKPFEEIIRHEKCREILKAKLARIQEMGGLTAEQEDEEAHSPDEITLQDEEEVCYIYQIHPAYVHDDNNQAIGTAFIFNDITDLRNVERMKTEFVSIVSHELRTPLTPMKGFVSMLLGDPTEEMFSIEDRLEFYGIIDENVDRLGRLINDLLNVSRIEKMGPDAIEMAWELVDLRKATETVVATQKGRTDKHFFVIDFDPETIIVETDADKIQNILHNIINNAIKYAPDGGEVRITARTEPASEQFPAGALLMSVKDQGMGIPEHALPKLGKMFNVLPGRAKIGGTGIGLYLVTNLVRRHGGVMWPTSDGPGKGATFWFRIPMRQPKPEENTEQQA